MRTKNVFSWLGVLFVIGSFQACVNVDRTLGIDFVPNDERLTLKYFDTTGIPIHTSLQDSIITSGNTFALFGSRRDAPFGTTTVGAVFRMYPSVLEVDFGDNPQLVSARLHLTMSGNQVHSSQASIMQNIRVYQVTKVMSDSLPYYNNSLKSSEYNHTPISQSGVLYDGSDTLSIPLSSAFGDFLLGARAEDMETYENYFNYFRGLYLMTDSLPAGVEGGRINGADLGSTYLELKYKHNGADSTYYFFVESSDVHFNTFAHESWNTLVDTTNLNSTIYVEGMAGVKPVLDMTYLKTLLENWIEAGGRPKSDIQKLVILNAQIILGADTQQVPDLSGYPGNTSSSSKVSFCYKYVSDDNYITYTPLDDTRLGSSNGVLNRSLLNYSLDISHYLNNYLRGKNDDKSKLFLSPLATVTDSYYGTSSYILDAQTYYHGAICGATHATDPVKFKMTYTFLE